MTEKEAEKVYSNIPIMNDNQYVEWHRVLGDKVRHMVFKEIVKHPGLTGKEILVKFKVTQPTLSFHIAQLVKCGLISDKKVGQSHTYYPNISKMLSFHKTMIQHHTEIHDYIGKMYNAVAPFIQSLKFDKGNK